jgi:hypothetical protein
MMEGNPTVTTLLTILEVWLAGSVVASFVIAQMIRGAAAAPVLVSSPTRTKAAGRRAVRPPLTLH